MPKRPSKSVKPDTPPAKARTEAETAETRGLSPLEYRLFSQVFGSIWMHPETTQDRKLHLMATAMTLTKGIKPTDDIERMLAAQMVATHNSAMECLRRAALESQTFEGRDVNLKHAAKLLAIYASQMDALNKHRGKGQQKVTVEHVHIESGAQAVVGNVEAGDKTAPPASNSTQAPKAISHSADQRLDLKAKTATPVRRHRR